MKFFFLLAIVFLQSCLNENHDGLFIVERISQTENLSLVEYQIQAYNILEFDLIDSVGKYQVGDTLILTKK